MKILVVDDSRIMRNIVKNALLQSTKLAGATCLDAADGAEALRIIESTQIDLLLLDWNMPMMNGLELVKRLRNSAVHAKLPIIMITSESAKYNVIEAVKAGVNDYLIKPVSEKALLEKVDRLDLLGGEGMNIAHIEPFIDATVGLFRNMLKIESEYQTPYLLNKDSHFEWDISGIIGIGGDSKGVVVISFESVFATAITGDLVGHDVGIDDPDVVDAIGELVNIIAGNAKKGLEEFRLDISLPSIVRGAEHRISWPSGAPIIGIPFKTASGKFHLSVGLENIIRPV